MSEVRLGMIGCGLISHAHARAARRCGRNVRFVACTSRTIDRASEWACQYDCDHFYPDAEAMLERENLDGVVVTTWPSLHFQHVMLCLVAGIRFVLCEKPLVTHGKDAVEIWRRARLLGATVLDGFMYRYHPAMEHMHALAADRELGSLDHIRGVFNMAYGDRATDSWRVRPDAGGGVPYDFACYPVDGALQFTDSLPVRVFATGSRDPRRGAVERLFAQVEFEDGCVADIEASRRSTLNQAFELNYERGTLSLPMAWSIPGPVSVSLTRSDEFLDQRVREYHVEPPTGHGKRLIDFGVFALQMAYFARLIRGEARPLVPLGTSVINAFVIDAMLDSLEAGAAKVISLPDEVVAENPRKRP